MEIPRINSDTTHLSGGDPLWESVPVWVVEQDWRGEPAESQRHFKCQLAWNEAALFIRFLAERSDECVINRNPILDSKTLGLWDRDVCEIFLAPDIENCFKYFEFEIAPTGEWVDLAIEIIEGDRKTDSGFCSGAIFEALSLPHADVMSISIPWVAVGVSPTSGFIFRGNIFRCTGSDPGRGYLALWPTRTELPNFHVPSAFGVMTLID